MKQIDRRTFISGIGLGALAWACARGSKRGSNQGPNALSVVATAPMLAKGDSRMALALFRGQRAIAPKQVSVRLVPAQGQAVRVPVLRERAVKGAGGDQPPSEVFEIYVFRHAFDHGNIWQAELTTEGDTASAAFQVLETAPYPLVGQRAIASLSPTVTDNRGVSPICTRTPPCSMHEVTIADALQSAKPTVVIFGTPEFCTSRVCGPTVDIIESVKKSMGDKASFIHVEVWKNDKDAVGKTGGEAPTYAQWKLDTDPITYFIAPDGLVEDRWVGPVGERETRQAVAKLLA